MYAAREQENEHVPQISEVERIPAEFAVLEVGYPMAGDELPGRDIADCDVEVDATEAERGKCAEQEDQENDEKDEVVGEEFLCTVLVW